MSSEHSGPPLGAAGGTHPAATVGKREGTSGEAPPQPASGERAGAAQMQAVRSRFDLLAIAAMFLLSGFAGLTYETLWFKQFSLMWGNTSLAVAAVVGTFLFGLGVGAYWLGRFADRVASPLRWYGILELAVGALAALIPYETAWAWNAASAFYVELEGLPLLHSLARCA